MMQWMFKRKIKKKTKNKLVYFAYIGLKKVYNMIPRTRQWIAMKEVGVPNKIRNAAKAETRHQKNVQRTSNNFTTSTGFLEG